LKLMEKTEGDSYFSGEEPGGGEEDITIDPDSGLNYSKENWIKTRTEIEEGRFGKRLREETAEIEISTVQAPVSPPPQVEFTDSGTSLSVTGRKLISFNYTGKKYLKDQTSTSRPKSTSLFDITQQMQVRMQGKVGEKIAVNVDYDDTKADKQDISVVYQGDPNEVVQNVSFGDIDLSLPATEFVSYNKQLFGIRADLRTNRLKMTFIGSRTKGETKTKQFTGNTQFQSLDIVDTNYIRRKYYDITFGNTARLPIKSGTEKIYLDQQTNETVDGILISSMTADDLAVSTSTYTGRFKLLTAGVDYVIDYVKGLVTFNRTLNSQDVVIADYRNYGGASLAYNSSPADVAGTSGTGRLKLVKTLNDIYVSTDTEAGWRREIKTYYSIGQTNIVRDDGKGNFGLKVQDLNRQEVGASLTPAQKYPDTIDVDFEQGIFNLQSPFASETDPSEPDPQIYSASPVSKRVIHIEYYYRLKTFTLEAGIVLNSEIIRVDGKKLNKNEEYYIDYDSGFITFYYPDRIGQNSVIDITYDVSPLGGTSNQSLVGGRVSYDLSGKLSLGSTLLYQGNVKSNTTPNVTDLANSMLVYEGDVQLKNLNLLGLKTSLSGEIAQSKINPNLNDYALIDNMEGIKQEDTANLDHNYWQPASNPSALPSHPSALSWTSQDIKSSEINPNSATDSTQKVLILNYDFSVSTEISIVFPFSSTGLDFSQKNSFELIIKGDSATGPLLNLHFGQVNEDSDSSGGQTLICSNGVTTYNAPKTEDTNCDGQLSNSEDTGWLYAAPSSYGYPTARYGASNGRIDTQDLNSNGRLDSQDLTGGDFGYVTNTKFKDNSDNNAEKNQIDFTGWHTWVYPIVIPSTETYKWAGIKQIRLTLKKGGTTTGSLQIARVAAVGNTWNVNTSTTAGTLQLLAVNNIDNSDYNPIYNAGGEATSVYNDLYESASAQKSEKNLNNLSEQALEINYSGFVSASAAYVYRKFSRAVDISQHQEMRFLLNNSAVDSGNSFYLKFGDENNYYKASIPLDFTGWRLYTISQTDLTGDNIPDVWANGGNYSVAISTKGTFSLQQVPQMIAGLETADAAAHNGKVYLNEIHLAEPITKTGSAKKVQGDFEIAGFMSFGGKYRFVDRNFQTPVTAITNQDNEQQTAYLNLAKPSFFPTSYTASRQITVTPNTYLTGSNNLVNSLQQGRVEKFDGTASGNLSLWSLPKFGLNYAKNQTIYHTLAREDNRDIYSANTSYSLPLKIFIIPKTIALNYSYTMSKVNYDAAKLVSPAGFYNTDERTEYYSTKLAFTPFGGASFNPGYSLSRTREQKFQLSDPSDSLKYAKAMQQTVEANSSFRLISWLNPSANYSITTIENNNLTVATVTVAQSSAVFNTGEIKTVNRTSQGSVNLTLNMNEIMPRNKLLRSFVVSSNYQLQDGDVWQNMEKSFDSRKRLWIRDGLKPSNPYASKTSLTTRDTYSSTQRWQPFEGYSFKNKLSTLSTLSISNNYNLSSQKTFTTGTRTQTVNKTFPDLIFTLSQLETLFKAQKWAYGATMNLKYSKNSNETKTSSLETAKTYGTDLRFRLLNYIDSSLSYNFRTGNKMDLKTAQKTSQTKHHDATLQGTFDHKKFRFTPKIDFSKDYAEGTLKTVTQDVIQITPSVLIKTDIQAPKGLKLPFAKDTVMFTNRIIWTNTISYAIKKSPITSADNNKLLSLNSVADYEASKNLRVSFNASVQRLWHKYLKQEEYLSYQAGSTVTFQF